MTIPRQDINAYLTPHYSVLTLLSFRDFLNLNRAVPDLQGAALLSIFAVDSKTENEMSLASRVFFLQFNAKVC